MDIKWSWEKFYINPILDNTVKRLCPSEFLFIYYFRSSCNRRKKKKHNRRPTCIYINFLYKLFHSKNNNFSVIRWLLTFQVSVRMPFQQETYPILLSKSRFYYRDNLFSRPHVTENLIQAFWCPLIAFSTTRTKFQQRIACELPTPSKGDFNAWRMWAWAAGCSCHYRLLLCLSCVWGSGLQGWVVRLGLKSDVCVGVCELPLCQGRGAFVLLTREVGPTD